MPAEARRAQGGPGRCLILGLLRQVQKSQVGQDWKGTARGRQEGSRRWCWEDPPRTTPTVPHPDGHAPQVPETHNQEDGDTGRMCEEI